MSTTEKDRSERRLVVLGSTGSIGAATLEVVEHLNRTGGSDPIRVVGLAAGRGGERLVQQAREFDVPLIAVADPRAAEDVRGALPDRRLWVGPDAALELVRHSDATDLSAAIVGSAGLPAVLCAIERGMRIGLANKETLVAAGAIVTPMLRRHGASLYPVDSEHSAIFQCLQSRAVHGPSGSADHAGSGRVKRIVLTASGGPFRARPVEAMRDATVEEALNHPTWKMGPKITIDSATMMNKALEIVEAHWLFDLPGDQIEVIIHPQSVVHSFVEFEDHSVLAQLGPPDMKTPIQYALTCPDRPIGCGRSMDWSTLARLDFEQPDPRKFPSIGLAYDVIEAGGTAGAVFNAANEAAVAAFLDRRIPLGRVVELVAQTLAALPAQPLTDLAQVFDADRRAREFVNRSLNVSA